MNNDHALQQFRVRSDRLKLHDSERQELIEVTLNHMFDIHHALVILTDVQVVVSRIS